MRQIVFYPSSYTVISTLRTVDSVTWSDKCSAADWPISIPRYRTISEITT